MQIISLYKQCKPYCTEFTFNKCSYFDGHPNIQIGLFGYTLTLTFPWINKKWTDECDPPTYGIQIHDNTFWIMLGGKGNMNGGNKWIAWDFPFLTMNHYRHSVKLKDGSWHTITDNDSDDIKYLDYRNQPTKTDAKVYDYDYTDSYDGSIIPCIFRVERREWRRKWLMWTDKFNYVKTYIEISFKDEVGGEKGSWKGGVIGCDYILKENETPIECIRRMEKERKL